MKIFIALLMLCVLVLIFDATFTAIQLLEPTIPDKIPSLWGHRSWLNVGFDVGFIVIGLALFILLWDWQQAKARRNKY